MSSGGESLLREVRAWGRTFPGAHAKAPWPGHDDLAVRDKTFAYLSAAGEPFKVSFKLPYTGELALVLPYANPTGHNLGRSGWVTFEPQGAQLPTLDQLKEWMGESYRAQAPRKLVKEFDDRFCDAG